VARTAIDEALVHLYAKYDLEDGDLRKFDAMDADGVREALGIVVCSYVYHRWLQDLGQRIFERTIDAREAVRLERQVEKYVRATVKLDLNRVDVLAVDWERRTGQQLVERIYREAYAFLEI
jgi:hypothetical protein